MTTVSVVIPTVNRVEFLRDAVESVLDQTYRDLECLVVDGGSTDGTRSFLDSIEDERLRRIGHDGAGSPGGARNAGLEAATGRYVVFLDDDDRLFASAVETLVESIRPRPPTCGGVCTAMRDVLASGETRDRRVTEGPIERFEDLSIKNPSCTLIRASVVDDVGGFDESYPAREDAEFWIRFFAEYEMLGVDKVCYERRRHDDQASSDAERMLRGNERLVAAHGDALSDAEIASRYFDMGSAYAELGQPAAARGRLRRAIERDPWRTKFWYYYLWCHLGTAGYRSGRTAHHRFYRPVVRFLRSARG